MFFHRERKNVHRSPRKAELSLLEGNFKVIGSKFSPALHHQTVPVATSEIPITVTMTMECWRFTLTIVLRIRNFIPLVD